MRWSFLLCACILALSSGVASAQLDGQAPEVPAVDGGVGPEMPGASPAEIITDPTFGIGVVVGASVLGLAAWLAFRGGAKFVTKQNVLENPTRYQMYEFLTHKPGTHLRAIAEALSLSTTNVLWHLRKLEEADLVRSEKLEGYKLFYPVAGGTEGKRKAMASAVLRNRNAQAILEYIGVNPGAHQREIARGLEVNHGTVRWHLRKMLATDVLMEVRTDQEVQYYLSDLGAAILTPIDDQGGHALTGQGSGSRAKA